MNEIKWPDLPGPNFRFRVSDGSRYVFLEERRPRLGGLFSSWVIHAKYLVFDNLGRIPKEEAIEKAARSTLVRYNRRKRDESYEGLTSEPKDGKV